MFCITKKMKQRQYKLLINQDIFPRPTPWLVAWKAFGSWLLRRPAYRFVYFPPQIDLQQYAVDAEDDTIVLRDRFGEEVQHAASCRMTWQLWALYIVESWLCGPMLRFWKWRWAEEKVQHMARRKTERIEPDDD